MYGADVSPVEAGPELVPTQVLGHRLYGKDRLIQGAPGIESVDGQQIGVGCQETL